MDKEDLARYRERRDFRRTEEPQGTDATERADPRPIFVIQHHIARAEHFDFRLEVDGVLKSWAVPRGPSTDPRVKRLAIPTEDHPLEYAEFEGTIPAGEYGGGTVQLWDTGHYKNTTRKSGTELSMAEGLEHGHVSVRLHGQKLSGRYALNRMRTDDDEEAWLLVKERDKDADARRHPVVTEPRSVETGRTLEEIAQSDGRTLHGHDLDAT
ncbi:DNA ligase [Spiractinospora alimapuensis]|uniref:DNA polymerase ligase N-terminal domain-containing protein n=1 Tax=Spiractinospora alimapuensis TaxID=2820884 RepID=UPI001F181CD2|nr:DNA polymerase ligase N-terminal domain-containing protein [Spiractinospora alimapuensis]QVQ50803.1 DNA ligase [Spiractinospora alimapuensis]